MFSSKLILFSLATLLVIVSAADPLCIKKVDGYTFNLCPLNTPLVLVSPDYGSPPAVNIIFGVAKPNVKPCKQIGNPEPVNKDTFWMSVTNKNGCYHSDFQPILKVAYVKNEPGLDMYYSDGIVLRLLCNSKASPSAPPSKITYYGQEMQGLFIWSTSSYYGCPIKTPSKRLRINDV